MSWHIELDLVKNLGCLEKPFRQFMEVRWYAGMPDNLTCPINLRPARRALNCLGNYADPSRQAKRVLEVEGSLSRAMFCGLGKKFHDQ